MPMFTDQRARELQCRISATTDRGERVSLLNELSGRIRMEQPRLALRYAAQALRLARSIGDDYGACESFLRMADCQRFTGRLEASDGFLAEAELVLASLPDASILRAHYARSRGLLHRIMGAFPSAMEWFERALEIYRTLNRRKEVVELLAYLGDGYMRGGDFVNAMKMLVEALELAEQGEEDMLEVVLINLGTLYVNIFDYDSALIYLLRAAERVRGTGARVREAEVLEKIGAAYRARGEMAMAVEYLTASADTFREQGMRLQLASALYELGACYGTMGMHQEALDRMREALVLSEEVNFKPTLVGTLGGIGGTYRLLKRYEPALYYLHRAIKEAEAAGMRRMRFELCESIANVYEAMGETDSALRYFRLYMAIRDEIEGHEVRDRIATLEARIEVANAEREREVFRLKAQQLEADMEHGRRELVAMALHLTQKNEFVAGLRRQIESLRRSSPSCGARVVRELLPKIDENINADAGWSAFEEQFHKVHPGFVQLLLERWPEMTPTELKVCALMRTQLNTKQIASLLSTSQRTVEGHRRFIRRKLELGRDENLQTFLAALR